MATYTVKGGDTLSAIAARYGTTYQQIARDNGISNPNLIRPGQVLNIGGGGGSSPAPAPQPAPSYSQPSYSPPQQSSNNDFMRYYQGWNEDQARQDFNQVFGGNIRKLEVARGVSPSESGLPNAPTINIQEIYDKAFNSADIGAAKEQIKMKQDEITKRRAALAQAESDINDNPFYSEATRVGRIAKLQDRAQADIGNFANEVALAEQALGNARGEAESKVNIAMKQYDISRQEYQDKINQVNYLIESGALMGASSDDLVSIARATGVAPSFLQGVTEARRKASEPPPTLQTFDDGNQQYILAIDSGGNIINRQAIGASSIKSTAAGKGGGSGTSTAQAKADAQRESSFYKAIDDGIRSLQTGTQWGTVWNRIKLLFPEVDASVIDTLLGTEWREPGAYQAYRQTTAGNQYNPPNKSNAGSKTLF